jgi:serine/threonine protein kinase
MTDLKYSGGDLIGSGSFGCVFHPAIKCKGQKIVDKDTVSKIFFSPESKQEALEEMKIDNMIRKIKGNTQWAHIWDKNCVPNKYSNIEKNEPKIEQCLYNNGLSEYDFDKYRRMLQGTYAGVTMDHVFNDLFKKSVLKKRTLFVKNFLQMMRLMKPLFIGLVEMYKNNISHNDIKFDNIMIDDDGCKFIDFGLAAKTNNLKFYKQRSMSEFVSDRIYPPYPYEFIYLYATNDVLEDERDDKEYDIYRDLHDRYQLVHETIFERKKLKEYLLGLIHISKDGALLKDKQEIISLIDTYSVGILIPYALARLAKKYKLLTNLQKIIVSNHQLRAFFDLFKSMSDPDHHDRMDPISAYNRYIELEHLYLSKKNKIIKKTIKRTHRRNK